MTPIDAAGFFESLSAALATEDVSAIFDHAAAVVADGLAATAVQIWLLDDVTGMVELHAHAGSPIGDELHTRMPVEASWIGRVARDGHAQSSTVRSLTAQSGAEGLATAHPLRIGSRSIGAMAVYSDAALPEAWGEVLPAAARLVAVAADRRRAAMSHARLMGLLDATPDLVTVGPVSGPPLYINPAARRALGIGPTETVESLLEFRPPGFGTFFDTRVHPIVEREGAWRGETDYVTRDGDVIHVSQVSVAHCNENGEMQCISTISRDITEEAIRSAELARSGERTRFALEAARAGVWENDLKAGRIIWSETMRAVQGFEAEEFSGTFESFLALVHPADRDEVERAIRTPAAGANDLRIKFRALWPDGSTHWVESHGRVVRDEAGRPVRMLGMAQDVTDRENLELQLRQAQKMEAIGQLAGGVAHDFNNLLTVILGYGNLLAEAIDRSDPRFADLEEIQRAARSAAELTQQLLAFSRRQLLQPTLIAVNELVTESARMLGRLVGENIELALLLQPGLAAVRADPGQMSQMLVNLAVNARDAMPRGGTLSIRTANQELDQSEATALTLPAAGRYVSIAVSDTGIGMDEQTKARIFEPFFTTKGAGKGTGLGLATVFGIVAQSGGAIGVESQPGRGAQFKIWLPAAAERAEHPEDASHTSPPARATETVLLVEDDPSVRALAFTALTRAGYRVLAAAEPRDAIDLSSATSGPIHIVVSDVVMPRSSGPELYARLRVNRPNLRALFVSGFALDTVDAQGVSSSGAAFLPKPFIGPELTAKVREVLDAAPAPHPQRALVPLKMVRLAERQERSAKSA